MIDFRDVHEFARYKASRPQRTARMWVKVASTNLMIWTGLALLAVVIVEWHHISRFIWRV